MDGDLLSEIKECVRDDCWARRKSVFHEGAVEHSPVMDAKLRPYDIANVVERNSGEYAS